MLYRRYLKSCFIIWKIKLPIKHRSTSLLQLRTNVGYRLAILVSVVYASCCLMSDYRMTLARLVIHVRLHLIQGLSLYKCEQLEIRHSGEGLHVSGSPIRWLWVVDKAQWLKCYLLTQHSLSSSTSAGSTVVRVIARCSATARSAAGQCRTYVGMLNGTVARLSHRRHTQCRSRRFWLWLN